MKGKPTEKQFNKMLEDAYGDCGLELKADHYYLAGGFNPTAPKRHTCLRWGNWCWKNIFEHPQDLLIYLRRKLPIKG